MVQAISIWVRVAGVWKRVDPPHINVSGVWKKCVAVYVRVSGVWKKCYVDDAGALSAANINLFGLDLFDPFSSGVGHRLETGGDIETWVTSPDVLFDFSPISPGWLKYDLNRAYEVKYTDITLGSHTLDDVPTLSTWLVLGSGPYKLETSKAEEGIETGKFDLDFRRNEGTPTSILRTVQVELTAEAGLGQ